MINFYRLLQLIFILCVLNINYSLSDNCDDQILEIKTTSVPDEFQAKVILNSFLKERIIDDMSHWFTESHFPYGNSNVWHKINLNTSTIDLSNYGINEKLLMIYYDSQNYCGVGGQCSTYLLRKINNVWEKIDMWHEVKWEKVYISSCDVNNLYIQLDNGNDFGAKGPDHGKLININLVE